MNINDRIRADARWQEAIKFGEPRPGHPEGTIAAHIEEVLRNLRTLQAAVYVPAWMESELITLALVHDAFKGKAMRGVPIEHPQSHASLAAAFLAEYDDDDQLLEMVRRHDEPYALWKRVNGGGQLDKVRYWTLLNAIREHRTFNMFQIIDNITAGKDPASTLWWIEKTTPDLIGPAHAVIRSLGVAQ